MSARTPKRGPTVPVQRQAPPSGARPRFKLITIKDPDPFVFAKKKEDALNEYTGEGWSVAGMMDKAGALIITFQRLEFVQQLPSQESQQPDESRAFFLPPSSTDSGHTEVVYSWLENGQLKTANCSSMPDAMNRVRAHLIENAGALPNLITVMSVLSYEPMRDLAVLDRTYPALNGG